MENITLNTFWLIYSNLLIFLIGSRKWISNRHRKFVSSLADNLTANELDECRESMRRSSEAFEDDIRSLKSDLKSLQSEIAIKDRIIELQALALEEEYERRKAAIAANARKVSENKVGKIIADTRK